jgi:hypothetical protein
LNQNYATGTFKTFTEANHSAMHCSRFFKI